MVDKIRYKIQYEEWKPFTEEKHEGFTQTQQRNASTYDSFDTQDLKDQQVSMVSLSLFGSDF